MRLTAATLLCLCAALELQPAAVKSFDGHWISSGTDDRIALVTITRDARGRSVDITDACGTAACAHRNTPLFLFGSENKLESQRGLVVLKQGPLLTHITLRANNEVLYVDTFEFGLGRTFRRHRQSRLVRQVPFPTSDSAVAAPFPSNLFEQFFGEVIRTPGYYVDPSALCGQRPNATSTAYLRVTDKTSSLMTLRFGENDSVTATRRTVLTPAGRIRVLVAYIVYAETIGDAGLLRWQRAQAAINADHAAFAASRGYDRPLVVFDNTNVGIQRSEIADPRNTAQIRAVVQSKGARADDFDAVMVIDLDPMRLDGGLATLSSRSIYVGNFAGWKSPLDAEQWRGVAITAYHHEFAHLWGWEHDWSPKCYQPEGPFAPFPTSPALLGWADLDGDRVPEILDLTPYGRVRQ